MFRILTISSFFTLSCYSFSLSRQQKSLSKIEHLTSNKPLFVTLNGETANIQQLESISISPISPQNEQKQYVTKLATGFLTTGVALVGGANIVRADAGVTDPSTYVTTESGLKYFDTKLGLQLLYVYKLFLSLYFSKFIKAMEKSQFQVTQVQQTTIISLNSASFS